LLASAARPARSVSPSSEAVRETSSSRRRWARPPAASRGRKGRRSGVEPRRGRSEARSARPGLRRRRAARAPARSSARRRRGRALRAPARPPGAHTNRLRQVSRRRRLSPVVGELRQVCAGVLAIQLLERLRDMLVHMRTPRGPRPSYNVAYRSANQGLPGAKARRGQDQARGPTLPQAPPRTQDPPPPLNASNRPRSRFTQYRNFREMRDIGATNVEIVRRSS
jgi:hypothetical protein